MKIITNMIEHALSSSFINFLETHRYWGYLALFLGVMIEGEVVLLMFSFLASQGFFMMGPIFLLTFFGVIIADNLWYELGKEYGQKIIDRFGEKRFFKEKMAKIQKMLTQNKFRYIFFSKFAYGLNHLIIMMVGYQKEDPKKIMKTDMISTAIWIVIVSSIGYSFGYAFKAARDYLKELTLAAILMLIFFSFFEKIVKKFFNSFSEKNGD